MTIISLKFSLVKSYKVLDCLSRISNLQTTYCVKIRNTIHNLSTTSHNTNLYFKENLIECILHHHTRFYLIAQLYWTNLFRKEGKSKWVEIVKNEIIISFLTMQCHYLKISIMFALSKKKIQDEIQLDKILISRIETF